MKKLLLILLPLLLLGVGCNQKLGGGFYSPQVSNSSGGGGGDVLAAGNNSFTGTNGFAGATTMGTTTINKLLTVNATTTLAGLNVNGTATFNGFATFATSSVAYLHVGTQGPFLPNEAFRVQGNVNNTFQMDLQNTSTGTAATGDIVVTADDGTDSSQYIDLGLNGSGYVQPTFDSTGAHDGYLYTSDGNLVIGTASSPKVVKFIVGGTTSSSVALTLNGTQVLGPKAAATFDVGNLGANGTFTGLRNLTGSNPELVVLGNAQLVGGSVGLQTYVNFSPNTNNALDLGLPSNSWRNGYISSTLFVNNIIASGAVTLSSTTTLNGLTQMGNRLETTFANTNFAQGSNISFGNANVIFSVNTSTVNCFDSTGFQSGSRVTVRANNGTVFNNNQTCTGVYKKLLLANGANITVSTTNYMMLDFTYDGTEWLMTTPPVNL